MPSADFDAGLQRLLDEGFIEGERQPFMGSQGKVVWSRLRITARGLVVLGEWPDLDRIMSAAGIREVLRAIADSAPPEERSALNKAAGFVGGIADDVVRATVAGVSGDAVEGALS